MLIQSLEVSLFIFSLANHTAGVPTVITHPEFNHDILSSAGLRDCSTMSGEEDLMKQVRTGEEDTRSRRRERGDDERKGGSEMKGIYDEGIGCWRVSEQGDGLCSAYGATRAPGLQYNVRRGRPDEAG